MTSIVANKLHTPAERHSDRLVHLTGLALAAFAVPALIAAAILHRGDWGAVGAVMIYSGGLLAMLGASAVYNITYGGRWSPILQRLDHSAIYLKIAGSFTPLAVLSGATGKPFLIALWLVALVGMCLKVISPNRLRWLGLSLYLGMGWVGVIAGGDMFGALSPRAMVFVVLGGTIYTAGVLFFLWESLPFHTTIWHVFVLVATAFIYTAILLEVLREIEIVAP